MCKKKVEVAGKKNLKIAAFLYNNKHTKICIDENHEYHAFKIDSK